MQNKINDFRQLLSLILMAICNAINGGYRIARKSKPDPKVDLEVVKKPSQEVAPVVSNPIVQTSTLTIQKALQAKDYQKVLQLWDMRKTAKPDCLKLCEVVEAMQGCKKGSVAIAAELQSFIGAHPSMQDMSLINDLLDTLARQRSSYLAELVVEMLPSIGLLKDQRTFETLLGMHLDKHSFVQAERLYDEMTEAAVEITGRTKVNIMAMALGQMDFDKTLRSFEEVKPIWTQHSIWGVPVWKAQKHKVDVMTMIVELACHTHNVSRLLPALEDMQLNEEAVNMMLVECLDTNDLSSAKLLEAIAKANQAPVTDATYSLLIKCFSSRPWGARALVKEAVLRDSEKFSEGLALAILDSSPHRALVDTLYERMVDKSQNVLAAFVRFYANGEHCEEALDILERHLPTFQGTYLQHSLASQLDAHSGWILMLKAFESGRSSLGQHVFETAASKVMEKHVVTIQRWWKHGLTKKQEQHVILEGVRCVSSRLTNVFSQAAWEYDEELALSSSMYTEPTKVSKTRARKERHVHFEDCSTDEDDDSTSTVGSFSDSEADSVDGWMAKEARRPPPGLVHPSACGVDFFANGDFDIPGLPEDIAIC